MKTNKQKCLEMWERFEKYPTEDKNDYKKYLISQGREDEYNHCWACMEATAIIGVSCPYCPITFPGGHCSDIESPYNKWSCAETEEERRKAAREMVKLIKETWEE